MLTTTPSLTDAGKSLLIHSLEGEALTLTGFKIGNGDAPANPGALVDLVSPMLSFGVSGLDDSTPGQLIVRGSFDNSEVQTPFLVKEFGLFAQGETTEEFTSSGSAEFTITSKPPAVNAVTVEDTPATIASYDSATGLLTLDSAPSSGETVNVRYPDGNNLLFAYSNEGTNASEIKQYGSNVSITHTVVLALEISSDATVYAYLTPESAYVLKSTFDAHLAATNPHNITKSTVGLGNVENKSVNNGTPTWTMASALQNLTSGETVSTAFGKNRKGGIIADKSHRQQDQPAQRDPQPDRRGGDQSCPQHQRYYKRHPAHRSRRHGRIRIQRTGPPPTDERRPHRHLHWQRRLIAGHRHRLYTPRRDPLSGGRRILHIPQRCRKAHHPRRRCYDAYECHAGLLIHRR